MHRRILYSMFDQGLRPDRPFAKCAKVVGDVMGTYHPHGDTAIYDAMVRMVVGLLDAPPTHQWTRQLRGHRSRRGCGRDALHGVPPRARWPSRCSTPSTKRPSTSSANYDNSTQQPSVLPSRFPNLLVNGSQGIAVGMATKIPPHNLGEVIDATLHLSRIPTRLLRRPDEVRQGPGLSRPRPRSWVARGSWTRTAPAAVRSSCARSPRSKRPARDTRIVVTEFPYEVSVESIEEKIYDLVKNGELEGIAAVQNDSAGRQARLVDSSEARRQRERRS